MSVSKNDKVLFCNWTDTWTKYRWFVLNVLNLLIVIEILQQILIGMEGRKQKLEIKKAKTIKKEKEKSKSRNKERKGNKKKKGILTNGEY